MIDIFFGRLGLLKVKYLRIHCLLRDINNGKDKNQSFHLHFTAENSNF